MTSQITFHDYNNVKSNTVKGFNEFHYLSVGYVN